MKNDNPFRGAPLLPPQKPALLGPEEIAEAVRQYRIRRQREQQPSDPVRPWAHSPPKPVALWTDVECIAYLCFVCETVAHLQGRERPILPVTDRVREWLDGLEEQADLGELGTAVIAGSLGIPAALARAYRLGRDEQRAHDAATADRE